MSEWNQNIDAFIVLASKYKVRMIMVGGGAVNFHGYKRHSADVDFWIEMKTENLKNLVKVFRELDYEIEDFPDEVKEKKQNISVKFSPQDLDLELITNFSLNKDFDESYRDSIEVFKNGSDTISWRILSLEDLIVSKIKAGRPKDLLDIQQLQIKNP
ncbi:MAG TPA: hypothetical protein ENH91_13965 [Leeuwenhoekiella sp.]|nr:hypothetical protein [Leeuwenhoekiella sp.]